MTMFRRDFPLKCQNIIKDGVSAHKLPISMTMENISLTVENF